MDIWIYGYMDIWIYGYMDIYMYMDIWIYGYMDTLIYGYIKTMVGSSWGEGGIPPSHPHILEGLHPSNSLSI